MLFGDKRIHFRRICLKSDMNFELQKFLASLFHSGIIKEENNFPKERLFPFGLKNIGFLFLGLVCFDSCEQVAWKFPIVNL